MGNNIISKRLGKGMAILLYIFSIVTSLGYFFDILRRGNYFTLNDLISFSGIIVNVLLMILTYAKKIKIRKSFAIVSYVVFLISIISAYLILDDSEASIYFVRDLIFLCIIIMFTTFVSGRMHALIMGALLIVNMLVYSFVLNNQFLIVNQSLLIMIFLGLCSVLFFIKTIFDASMNESIRLFNQLTDRNEEIKRQNNILIDQAFELKELNRAMYKKEEVLIQQKNEIHKANDAKNKLFSIVAHDLKDAVASIQGFSFLMNKSVDNQEFSKLKEFSLMINLSVEKLAELLDNILQWSRAQTKRIRFNKTQVNLYSVLELIIDQNNQRALAKNIEIKNSIPLDLCTLGDENLLHICIRNLLGNAIKFTENGSIEISANDFADHLLIEVIDEGIGMDKDKYDMIFKMQPGDNTLGTEGERGTGLGLSLCQEFVKMHHGQIGAKPNKNKGSIFWFTLPKEIKMN